MKQKKKKYRFHKLIGSIWHLFSHKQRQKIQLINNLPYPKIDEIDRELDFVRSYVYEINFDEYQSWLMEYLPDHRNIAEETENKKKIELFLSFKFAEIEPSDTIVDAAGGKYTYLPRVNAARKILQDRYINKDIREKMPESVEIQECDVSNISLPDGAVDVIVCHHSFEHFQGDIDIQFISECCRLIRQGGRLVIVPLFLSHEYIEITNNPFFREWSDKQSIKIIAPHETLPGRRRSGHFSRIYDLISLKERCLEILTKEGFDIRIVEPRLFDEPIPNMKIESNAKKSKLNKPFRVLVANKSGDS